MRPTLVRLLAPTIAAALALAGAARADDPTVYLTWNAPYGQPRATDVMVSDCDTTRADTLWLAFDPGKKSPTFMAMNASLLIHPRSGDSLSTSWSTDTLPGFNLRFLKPEADPVPGLGYPQPWKSNGVGLRTLESAGRAMKVHLFYAISYREATSIDRKIYVLARILIQRPAGGDPRCKEPVCIEWSEAEYGFSMSEDVTLEASGPNRFVSLNSPGGEVSVPYRKAASLHVWKPPTPH